MTALARPGVRRRRSRATVALCRLAVLLLALLGVLAGASPVLAHPSLVSSDPGAGYAVLEPPAEVVLRFSQPVTPLSDALVLTTDGGSPVPMTVTVEPPGATLRGVPHTALPVGGYQLSYRVVALDGDLVTGSVPFGVATAVVAGASGSTPASAGPGGVQPGSAALRAVLFAGLALALGGAVGAWNTARVTGGLPAARPLIRSGALLALLGAAGLLLTVTPGRLPDLASLRGPGAARLLLGQIALLAAAAALARRPARGALAGVALLGVVLLEGVRAHPREAAGAAGIALTAVHLAAAAVWIGALVHVLRLAARWRGKPRGARVAVAAYARLALLLVLADAVTGTISALLLLPSRQDWTGTAYGQVLLAKLAAFTAVLALAALARRRLHRSPTDPSPTSPSPAPLGRAARVEAGLLAGVLLLTAALTSATPTRLAEATPLLTAPTGPVLRTAERAHQITVAAVISTGRLELRAHTPDPGRPVRSRLTASLAAAGGPPAPVPLSDCGAGCWLGRPHWPDGTSRLTVDVAADGFTGGQVALDVPWPLTPAPQLLAAVQKTMGAQSVLGQHPVVRRQPEREVVAERGQREPQRPPGRVGGDDGVGGAALGPRLGLEVLLRGAGGVVRRWGAEP